MRRKVIPKIFYGWWIVGACFLISFSVPGVVTFGFTAFFEPIANEFGWSYTQISLAASIRGVEVGLLAPFIGLLIDRWGPRRLVLIGVALVGLGLVMVSRTTSLAIFYCGFTLVAIGFGGSSANVLMTTVANWFRRKVGLAIGIMASGAGFGGLLIPVIVRLIDLFDWQTTMLLLGLGIWTICLPLSLIVRHKPEQYGLLPDGEQDNTVIPHPKLALVERTEVDIGARDALKSRTFWHLSLGMTFNFIVASAVIAHVMPYLSSAGILRSTSSLVAAAIPVISSAGRLGAGWVGDRTDKKLVATGCFTMIGFSMLFFSYVSVEKVWSLVLFTLLFGIGWGGNITMRAALVREYFGRAKFGTIHGFMMGLLALGSVIGPFVAGLVYDTSGSYQSIWFAFAGLAVLALILVVTTPPLSTDTLCLSPGLKRPSI